jgi:hypothetical protein
MHDGGVKAAPHMTARGMLAALVRPLLCHAALQPINGCTYGRVNPWLGSCGECFVIYSGRLPTYESDCSVIMPGMCNVSCPKDNMKVV